MSTARRRHRPLAILASAVIAFLMAACCPSPVITEMASLQRLVAAIEQSPPTDHKAAERLVGARLSNESDRMGFYESQDLIVFNIPIERVTYFEPADDFEPASLTMEIRDVCLDRESIVRQYAPLAGDLMGSHLPGVTYSRMEPWGKLSFGFATRECLSEVHASVNRFHPIHP
jgi:hypothetical protein